MCPLVFPATSGLGSVTIDQSHDWPPPPHATCATHKFIRRQGNSVTRDLPPTGSEANTTIYIYLLDIDSHCPIYYCFSKQKNILFFIPRIFFSRNVGNSIKCKKTTPTFDMFEIKNQNKGIEDIMDIDSHCPYLLFGVTTSHLTSKWSTFQYFNFFLMLKIA